MGRHSRQAAYLGILAIAAALVLAIIPLMKAQDTPPPALVPIVSEAVTFAVTGPVTEMVPSAQDSDQESKDDASHDVCDCHTAVLHGRDFSARDDDNRSGRKRRQHKQCRSRT